MDLNWILNILTSPYMSLFLFFFLGYFCWHNVYDYNDLDDCLDAIDTNEATIFIPNQQTINENLTIPVNITLRVIQGGSLNVGKFSIRNATYQWTVSPAQAGEYFLELAGGGDPGLIDPLKVYEDEVLMDIGVLGALAVGEWNYGDNDGHGWNTIYVRIAGTVDPDTKAEDYVEAGYVVTINGQVESGGYQIFEGDGTVVVSTYPQQDAWWGLAQEFNFGASDVLAGNIPQVDCDTVDGEHAADIVTKARVDAVGPSHDSLVDVSVDDHHTEDHKAEHEVGGGDLVSHDALTDFVAAEHKSLPNTIGNVLSDHDKAAHDALNIDADQVDGEEAAAIVTQARVNAVQPTILGSGAVAKDHGAGATDQIINVCYSVDDPPAANTTTIGSLWIKYTA